jgi:hypothetical protein
VPGPARCLVRPSFGEKDGLRAELSVPVHGEETACAEHLLGVGGLPLPSRAGQLRSSTADDGSECASDGGTTTPATTPAGAMTPEGTRCARTRRAAPPRRARRRATPVCWRARLRSTARARRRPRPRQLPRRVPSASPTPLRRQRRLRSSSPGRQGKSVQPAGAAAHEAREIVGGRVSTVGHGRWVSSGERVRHGDSERLPVAAGSRSSLNRRPSVELDPDSSANPVPGFDNYAST